MNAAENERPRFSVGFVSLGCAKNMVATQLMAEGCNHRCAIPSIRGRSRSRTVDSIVPEAESILEQGYGERTLISQDSSAYGRELHNGSSLPELLRAIDRIGGRFWVRALYVYPSLITDELLEIMAATGRVCNYLDMPIQHSHPELLNAMNRAATIPYVEELPDRNPVPRSRAPP